MYMQMPGTFTESDRVHPPAAGECLHKLAAALQHRTEGHCLLRQEVDRTAEVAAGIQQQPARQGVGRG